MNHEELFHLRDKFLQAAIQGVLSNPNLVDRDTKPETVVHLANAVTNRALDAREQYYKYEDKKNHPASAPEYGTKIYIPRVSEK